VAETLVIASNNPGKHRELLHALAGLPYDVQTIEQRGICATIEETGGTFAENAALKATAYAAMSGSLTLADDSGIVVDALGGEPGVRSARFGGPGLDDRERTNLLLNRTAGVPNEQRTARFVCVIAIADDGGESVCFEGVCEGSLARQPAGDNGFGYDPVFVPAGETRTMAELSIDEKAAISHRGKALDKAARWLAERGEGR
jgi:XTP/dITP diphosphohydrolase